ncbi:MAG: hypothetical protein IIC75_00370 [Bacteroidetes bacterium]|nr:hypothetical protein [Bacteroidota bacterium]
MINEEKAIEVIIKSYDISAERKLTNQEIEQNKEITRIHGDEFVQSWLRCAAIRSLQKREMEEAKLHWVIRLRKRLLRNGSWKFNAWLRNVTGWAELNI